MHSILAYTDGAALGNPGAGGWAALILTPTEVVELGDYDAYATNNQMELLAIVRALEWLASHKQHSASITLLSDSKYCVRGASEWLPGWKKKGWITQKGEPVANRELWEELDTFQAQFQKLEFCYVPGHQGVAGNERADDLASSFAEGRSPELYSGSRSDYFPWLGQSEEAFKKPKIETRSSSRSQAKAYYLSWVDGQLEKHASWSECQQRVNGRSGAKFKKVKSLEEEKEILAKWGVATG